jgi:hypothetical protein
VVHTRAHGALRTAEGPSRVLDGQPVGITQQERLPLSAGQEGERSGELGPVRFRALVARARIDEREGRGEESLAIVDVPPGALARTPREARHDGVQVAGEPAREVQLAGALQDVQERLLGRVRRVLGVPRGP